MELVILTHPPALDSTSMPRFARMIGEGMRRRGHVVRYWTSPTLAGRIPVRSPGIRKWVGYLDQFLLYPPLLSSRLRRLGPRAVVVVSDQALGMWIPFLRGLPHVVHVHDFMALKSALGEFPENPTGASGRLYQNLIRRGFSKAANFISVSQKTREDLHRFLVQPPELSQVVYNGLNGEFGPLPEAQSLQLLAPSAPSDPRRGYLMHIGGNQWYKNRVGVLQMYRAWCAVTQNPVPLWMVGAPPTAALTALACDVPRGGEVHFVQGLSDAQVRAAYCLATCLLFPSLEEGFGWPIAEAMACGAPVLTTRQAPMTEVGGDAAYYLRRHGAGEDHEWEHEGAALIEVILRRNADETARRRVAGFAQAEKFSTEHSLDSYETAYREVLLRGDSPEK